MRGTELGSLRKGDVVRRLELEQPMPCLSPGNPLRCRIVLRPCRLDDFETGRFVDVLCNRAVQARRIFRAGETPVARHEFPPVLVASGVDLAPLLLAAQEELPPLVRSGLERGLRKYYASGYSPLSNRGQRIGSAIRTVRAARIDVSLFEYPIVH